MLSVFAGETDPVVRAQLFRDIRLQKGLVKGGLGFNQQDIRAGLMKNLHSATVEFDEDFIAHPVASAILGPIRQVGAVGADARKAQGPDSSGGLSFFLPPLVSCLHKQGDGAGNQLLCLLSCAAILHQSGNGCLIAAGNAAVGAGPEVIQMHLLYQVRCLFQTLRRPELRIQVGAQFFQGSGHGTVDDHNLVLCKDVFYGCVLLC